MAKKHKKPKTPKPQKPVPTTIREKSKGPRPSLYGFHAVREALHNPAREIQTLYTTEAGLKTIENDLKGIQPTPIDKKTLEKILPPGAVHQGLALACSELEEIDIQDLIIQAGNRETTRLVMLDQVTDPHNVGAILRSACVFGINGMIQQRKHAPDLTGVLAKTACGAVEHVPVAYETNLNRTLETLKEAGFFIYGLDERGQDLREAANLPDKIVLVLGAEGPGLRRLVKENCDTLLRLPTDGPISSLNVSNAAAVAFYALS